ncbi:MAG: hypothetical protein ACREMY_02170 [bacterium]
MAAATTKGKGKATKAGKAKPKAKPARKNQTLTKAQITHIAKIRREGGTWRDCYAYMGRRSSSTKLRAKLEAAGFDRFGRRGGKGKSKARGHGAKEDPNITPAPIQRGPTITIAE